MTCVEGDPIGFDYFLFFSTGDYSFREHSVQLYSKWCFMVASLCLFAIRLQSAIQTIWSINRGMVDLTKVRLILIKVVIVHNVAVIFSFIILFLYMFCFSCRSETQTCSSHLILSYRRGTFIRESFFCVHFLVHMWMMKV